MTAAETTFHFGSPPGPHSSFCSTPIFRVFCQEIRSTPGLDFGMSSQTERLSFLPDFPGRESLYHPLDASKDEIRVITVQPSQERSSAIHCSLQIISIQDGRSTKPYDAIPYVWGSTETTDKIIVHKSLSVDQPDCGIEVPVTYALTGAIR